MITRENSFSHLLQTTRHAPCTVFVWGSRSYSRLHSVSQSGRVHFEDNGHQCNHRLKLRGQRARNANPDFTSERTTNSATLHASIAAGNMMYCTGVLKRSAPRRRRNGKHTGAVQSQHGIMGEGRTSVATP